VLALSFFLLLAEELILNRVKVASEIIAIEGLPAVSRERPVSNRAPEINLINLSFFFFNNGERDEDINHYGGEQLINNK